MTHFFPKRSSPELGRGALLRRDLAQLAALFRLLARRCRRLRGAAAEQLGDGVTLGLGQLAQLAAHRGDGLALLERGLAGLGFRSEEHTSELQSLMRISYAVFCLKKKKTEEQKTTTTKM